MSRPKLSDGKTERLNMFISEGEMTAIDDWRFANRIASRSEAIRQLIKLGLSSSLCIMKPTSAFDEVSSLAGTICFGRDAELIQ